MIYNLTLILQFNYAIHSNTNYLFCIFFPLSFTTIVLLFHDSFTTIVLHDCILQSCCHVVYILLHGRKFQHSPMFKRWLLHSISNPLTKSLEHLEKSGPAKFFVNILTLLMLPIFQTTFRIPSSFIILKKNILVCLCLFFLLHSNY